MRKRFAKFSKLFTKLDGSWHKLAVREMAKYELNSAHAAYLHALYEAGQEGVTAAELAKLCEKNKADVSRMMAILIRKGLVKKVAMGRNMYRAKLVLTQEGIAAAERVQQSAEKAVELAGEGLSEEEKNTFYKALEVIATNLQKLNKEGLPHL